MQEQPEDLSGTSRNQSIDKPGPQESTNMDGKSQETMHMHYNLIYTMATTSGRKLLIWKLSKSKNINYSKILERLSMTRTRLPMHQRDTKRSEYTLYFDVNHCGKFKARLVADGHLTKDPMETVYSGVVSIRNLRLAMFLAELNNLELWGADVGNAYLQALTREKLYIVGGPEFEELQGHVLVMYKALYGTRSGGACWHDKFFDILHHRGFKPSRADPDSWMKSSKGCQSL